jgi:archaellum component FlaC
MKGNLMATQEERLTALEQTFATFRKENAAAIIEVEENTTIMLGVMRSQGRDIKRIHERLETVDTRLGTVETHLETIDTHLGTVETHLETIDTKLNEHTALLTQILERLPQTP